MFFVRMIRLVPLVVVLLIVGFVIYLIAQVKYSPNKAKSIVLKVFFWICIALTAFFLLWCLYSLIDNNSAAFDLFLSFATVPAFGLLIVLFCGFLFYKHHPNYKLEAKKTNYNESFKEFWIKRIKKFVKDYINKKMQR